MGSQLEQLDKLKLRLAKNNFLNAQKDLWWIKNRFPKSVSSGLRLIIESYREYSLIMQRQI